MPTRVINATLSLVGHSIYDSEKSTVADMGDITGLQNQIKSLQEDLKNLVTNAKLEGAIKLLYGKIENNANDFQSFEDLIFSALKDGLWKETFAGEIQNLLNDLESREKRINQALKEKMEQLAQRESTDEKIKRIFTEQEQSIRTIIQTAGMKLKSELDQKMANSEIINILRDESQTIKWE